MLSLKKKKKRNKGSEPFEQSRASQLALYWEDLRARRSLHPGGNLQYSWLSLPRCLFSRPACHMHIINAFVSPHTSLTHLTPFNKWRHIFPRSLYCHYDVLIPPAVLTFCFCYRRDLFCTPHMLHQLTDAYILKCYVILCVWTEGCSAVIVTVYVLQI